MKENDKQNSDLLFEPIEASDVSPIVLIFYIVAITLLGLTWSGVLVLNSSLLRFGSVLLLAAVLFGVVRSLIRYFRAKS